MVANEICSIEQCSKRVCCKGLCSAHYHRLLRYGDATSGAALRERPSGPCKVEGCSKSAKVKGLCNSHYLRNSRHGDPNGGRPSLKPGESSHWKDPEFRKAYFAANRVKRLLAAGHLQSKTTVPDLANEEWRQVEDWPSYAVSNYGRVKRLSTPTSKRSERLRKPIIVSGYLAVTLTTEHGARRVQTVHRLVAYAFLGPPPHPSMEVNHKDSDRKNAKVENLEWVTRSQNHEHAYQFGFACAKGERNGGAKLTDAAVISVRSRNAQTASERRVIAKELGISYATVCDVISRRTWSHI